MGEAIITRRGSAAGGTDYAYKLIANASYGSTSANKTYELELPRKFGEYRALYMTGSATINLTYLASNVSFTSVTPLGIQIKDGSYFLTVGISLSSSMNPLYGRHSGTGSINSIPYFVKYDGEKVYLTTQTGGLFSNAQMYEFTDEFDTNILKVKLNLPYSGASYAYTIVSASVSVYGVE